MGWLSTYFVGSITLVGTLVFVGVLLETIEQFIDGSDKARIRAKIEDFWLFTSELTTHDSVREAIKARRYRMRKKYIRFFIKLYFFFLIIVLLSACIGVFNSNTKQIADDYRLSVNIDFWFLDQMSYLDVSSNFETECKGNSRCIANSYSLWLKEISRLATSEIDYNEVIDHLVESNSSLLKIALATEILITLLIVAVPLVISLFISFHLTLWLLSIVTKSSLGILLIIIIDFSIAVIMPPLLLNIMINIGTLIIGLYLNSGLIDFSRFAHADLTALVYGRV